MYTPVNSVEEIEYDPWFDDYGPEDYQDADWDFYNDDYYEDDEVEAGDELF